MIQDIIMCLKALKHIQAFEHFYQDLCEFCWNSIYMEHLCMYNVCLILNCADIGSVFQIPQNVRDCSLLSTLAQFRLWIECNCVSCESINGCSESTLQPTQFFTIHYFSPLRTGRPGFYGPGGWRSAERERRNARNNLSGLLKVQMCRLQAASIQAFPIEDLDSFGAKSACQSKSGCL